MSQREAFEKWADHVCLPRSGSPERQAAWSAWQACAAQAADSEAVAWVATLAAHWLLAAKCHEASSNHDVGAALRENYRAKAEVLRECAEELRNAQTEELNYANAL